MTSEPGLCDNVVYMFMRHLGHICELWHPKEDSDLWCVCHSDQGDKNQKVVSAGGEGPRQKLLYVLPL